MSDNLISEVRELKSIVEVLRKSLIITQISLIVLHLIVIFNEISSVIFKR